MKLDSNNSQATDEKINNEVKSNKLKKKEDMKMVPILTILTFVGLIGVQMLFAYAKKRNEMLATEGVHAMNPRLAIMMQDGGEPIEKKEEKTEKKDK